jgi:hypothetical protein
LDAGAHEVVVVREQDTLGAIPELGWSPGSAVRSALIIRPSKARET